MYRVSTLKQRPSVLRRVLLGEFVPTVHISRPADLLDLFELGLRDGHVVLDVETSAAKAMASSNDPEELRVYCSYEAARHKMIDYKLSPEAVDELIKYSDTHRLLAKRLRGEQLKKLLAVCDLPAKCSAFVRICFTSVAGVRFPRRSTSSDIFFPLIEMFESSSLREQVEMLLSLISLVIESNIKMCWAAKDWLSDLAKKPPPLGPLAAVLVPDEAPNDDLWQISKVTAGDETIDPETATVPTLVAGVLSRKNRRKKEFLVELFKRFEVPAYLTAMVLVVELGADLEDLDFDL